MRCGEQRDLDAGVAGVLGVVAELGDDLLLALWVSVSCAAEQDSSGQAATIGPRACVDVAAHLLDEGVDGLEAPLAAQALAGTPARSVCAVEVAVEVDEVGLDQLAAARDELRRARRRSRRRRATVPAPVRRPAGVDAVARAGRSRGAGRGSRSGSRASRPRSSPCGDLAVDGERRARAAGRRTSTAPAEQSPRMWLELTTSPSTSSSGTTRVSKRSSAASSAASPCARWPKRKFSPTLTCVAPQRADEHVVDEALRRCGPRSAASNGIDDELLDAELADQLGLALQRRQQPRRGCPARRPRAGAARRSGRCRRPR